jgi:hypothetical protein
MKLEVKTEFSVVFRVEEYMANEGGMDYEQFGQDCESLKQALQVWHLATVQHPTCHWIIGCHPTVTTS